MLIVPGLLLCLLVTAAAMLVETAERAVFGRIFLDALVLSILLGTAVRSFWTPGARWQPGITFSAHLLLEVAVVALGASVSAVTIVAVGPVLLIGIVGIVAMAILSGVAIGRALGLPSRMALLIACGNSICGNSAIAAVAPVIGAAADDVAASIAFTAVLGIVVVLGLPILAALTGVGAVSYGAFAGLTVYAVPQVLAATTPLGANATQIGTVVKLVRVLMLGPVCLVLSLLAPYLAPEPAADGAAVRRTRPSVTEVVPWFIVGFLLLVVCRSLGVLPPRLIHALAQVATLLTVVSMSALGLRTDVRALARAGGRATAAVVFSLLALCSMSLVFLMSVGVPVSGVR